MICTWLQRSATWDEHNYASFHSPHSGAHSEWCGDWSTDWIILRRIANLPPPGGG